MVPRLAIFMVAQLHGILQPGHRVHHHKHLWLEVGYPDGKWTLPQVIMGVVVGIVIILEMLERVLLEKSIQRPLIDLDYSID